MTTTQYDEEVATHERKTSESSFDESKTKDNALLATLGYKQEFRREFRPYEIFGVSFSMIAVVPSIASVLFLAIPYGGSVAMVWGWAVSCFFIMLTGIAIAELASAAPTSGGLYYWTYNFASPSSRVLMSWLCGYANTIGNIGGVASAEWACAVQIMAAASIGSNFSFAPTFPQTFGVFCALLVIHVVIASRGSQLLARFQILCILFNFGLIFAIIIAVPAATPSEFRNSANYAFGNFTNLSGWSNGFAFILSFLTPIWSFGGFDSPVHMSEEATNASTAVPWAIVISLFTGCFLGWVVMIVLAFFMGSDLDSILGSPIGQPLATILFNCLGKRGTLALWAIIILVQFFAVVCIVMAASRQTFAFARDGALPFSRWIYFVNSRTLAPTHAVIFVALCALPLGALATAGAAAQAAIFALAIAAQYIAFTMPVAARLLCNDGFKPGPFHLGYLSMPISVTSVAWMIFQIVVFMFPSAPAPTALGMNWSCVVVGGVLLLATAYYYVPVVGGQHWFHGPISTIDSGIAPELQRKVSPLKVYVDDAENGSK